VLKAAAAAVDNPREQQAMTSARKRIRRNPTRAQPRGEPDLATSISRLVIGAVSLCSGEVVRRWQALPREPSPLREPAPNARERRGLTVGDIGAGLAIESLEATGRLVSIAARGSRRLTGVAGGARHVPVLGVAAAPVYRQYQRLDLSLRRLAKRGQIEERIGRRMVDRLIRDTAARSVTDIAQLTVNEVTHNPEVAALVRAQSTGIATDSIQEVRANSEQADASIERRVRTWLHLPESGEPERSGGDPARHGGA
jgi:hypothetical protein